jgi:hypothetical protein
MWRLLLQVTFAKSELAFGLFSPSTTQSSDVRLDLIALWFVLNPYLTSLLLFFAWTPWVHLIYHEGTVLLGKVGFMLSALVSNIFKYSTKLGLARYEFTVPQEFLLRVP